MAEPYYYAQTHNGPIAGFSVKPKPTKKNPRRRDIEVFGGAEVDDDSGILPPHIKFADEESAETFCSVFTTLTGQASQVVKVNEDGTLEHLEIWSH